MFTGVDFVSFIRSNPTLAVFFTVAVGFLIGKLRWRSFTLGTVTSVLLVGVAVGQFRIEVPEPAKTLFFLMFLFAVGYAVGRSFSGGSKRTACRRWASPWWSVCSVSARPGCSPS